MPANQPPRFKFKVGRVNCSVWKNGENHNTTFSVSYKKDDQTWGETSSFSRNDLPALASAAQFAVHLILVKEQDEPKDHRA